MRWWWLGLVVACGATSAPADDDARDARAEDDARDALSDEAGVDAGAPLPVDAAVDAAPGSISTWALYTIAPGAHGAVLASGAAGNPSSGLVSGLAGRDYLFAFDASAAYTITSPTQPNDQLDWNKLPGMSDCGTLDLAADGAMFGWRWRLDISPQVLEVTAYANDAGAHLTPPAPLFTLDAADLASVSPLRYRVWMDGALYRFAVSGTMRGRAIAAESTLPRRCAATAPSGLGVQWAAGFYFGGTSTSPSTITGRIFEQPFR